MKLALVIPAAMALAGASPSLPPNSTYISDGTPPVRYQGPGAAVVIMVDASDIDRMCGVAPPGYRKIACMAFDDGTPIIVVPNPCAFDSERFAHILCHEKGHSLGWPGSHGD